MDKENIEVIKKVLDSDDDDDLEYSRNILDIEDVNNNVDKS